MVLAGDGAGMGEFGLASGRHDMLRHALACVRCLVLVVEHILRRKH